MMVYANLSNLYWCWILARLSFRAAGAEWWLRWPGWGSGSRNEERICIREQTKESRQARQLAPGSDPALSERAGSVSREMEGRWVRGKKLKERKSGQKRKKMLKGNNTGRLLECRWGILCWCPRARLAVGNNLFRKIATIYLSRKFMF